MDPAPAPAPNADPRPARREARRAAIVDAAWALAREQGLAALSLRDLAARVGLRQPSLYVYFASKHDLYDAMFADGNRQLLAAVRSLPTASDPADVLATLASSLVRFSSDDIVRHQLLFQRTIPGFEPSPEGFAPALEFYDLVRGHLAAAGVTDQGDTDVYSAIVSGLSHQQVANDPGGRRWELQAVRVVHMFLADVARRRSTTPEGGNAP